jgi:hypothetical protein
MLLFNYLRTSFRYRNLLRKIELKFYMHIRVLRINLVFEKSLNFK